MGNPREWYRITDWGKKDQKYFEEKLSRAREYNRAQYLKIKAIHLFDTNNRGKRSAGYQLMLRMIQEYPHEKVQVLGAHEILGMEYWKDRKMKEAEYHLRETVDRCARFGSTSGTSGTAWLSLAMLILETKQMDKYKEAKDLLDSLEDIRMLFQDRQFDYFVTQARLANIIGENNEAAENAAKAIHLAQIEKPQFSRHPDLGNITISKKLIKELVQIANNGALQLE